MRWWVSICLESFVSGRLLVLILGRELVWDVGSDFRQFFLSSHDLSRRRWLTWLSGILVGVSIREDPNGGLDLEIYYRCLLSRWKRQGIGCCGTAIQIRFVDVSFPWGGLRSVADAMFFKNVRKDDGKEEQINPRWLWIPFNRLVRWSKCSKLYAFRI